METAQSSAKKQVSNVTIRFAGDSGDGMQLTGGQFSMTSAIAGNDISTFPDFPAEIRAPAGSLPGVSGFQVCFSDQDIRTPGDRPDVLVAMNPAALKVHLEDLPKGGIVILNTSAFTASNLKKAAYESNPLEDGTLDNYRAFPIALTDINAEALKDIEGLTKKDVDRCKNFFALGVMYWLYNRDPQATLDYLEQKFGKKPAILVANQTALKAGYAYGETTELFAEHYEVKKAELPQGQYRQITGNQALALGVVAAGQIAKKQVFYGSYPITPASEVLQELSNYKNFGVMTFQAEDEIAAVGATIGAAFGGTISVTGTSGPGLALKGEAIGLAVMAELPLVILNVQRAGPSTGMPTKTEQADLLQAMYGRNGESPVAVIAPASPSECFEYAIEAARLATKYMCPVIVLTDGALANGAEPWQVPDIDTLPKFSVTHATDGTDFQPYLRDPETLSRPWAIPGTPGLEHRIGGIEKQETTGNVSYKPENHEKMCRTRAAKIQKIADEIKPTDVFGDPQGDVLVIGWGSTYGAITTAVEECRAEGVKVSSCQLRYINPLPKDLGKIMSEFKKVLIPEMNLGQLSVLIRDQFMVDAISYPKIQGQPLKISEVKAKIKEVL